MNSHLITAFLLTLISISPLFAQDAKQEAGLPRVLIIGDSISLGYTPQVKQLLKDKANVIHNKGNAQHNRHGPEESTAGLERPNGMSSTSTGGCGISAIVIRNPKFRDAVTK